MGQGFTGEGKDVRDVVTGPVCFVVEFQRLVLHQHHAPVVGAEGTIWARAAEWGTVALCIQPQTGGPSNRKTSGTTFPSYSRELLQDSEQPTLFFKLAGSEGTIVHDHPLVVVPGEGRRKWSTYRDSKASNITSNLHL